MNKTRILFNKNYVINELFIREAINQKLNLNEFLLLVLFINNDGGKLDVQKIADSFSLNEEEVMDSLNSLIQKELISIVSNKDESGKLSDYINIDGVTNLIEKSDVKEAKKTTTKDIYSKFEKEFGRTISSMEYEIINEWLNTGFTEELILLALKEAIYNGVTNLRYIDKILFEWKKQGLKNAQEVDNYIKKHKENKTTPKELYDYDWISSDEE